MVQMISDFPPLRKVMIRFHRIKYVTTQPFTGRFAGVLLHTHYYWLITSELFPAEFPHVRPLRK